MNTCSHFSDGIQHKITHAELAWGPSAGCPRGCHADITEVVTESTGSLQERRSNNSSHQSPFRIPAGREENLTLLPRFAPGSSHSRNKICNLVNHVRSLSKA